jgi:hypothetical protein
VGDFELFQQVDCGGHDGCPELNRIKTRPNSLRLHSGGCKPEGGFTAAIFTHL